MGFFMFFLFYFIVFDFFITFSFVWANTSNIKQFFGQNLKQVKNVYFKKIAQSLYIEYFLEIKTKRFVP